MPAKSILNSSLYSYLAPRSGMDEFRSTIDELFIKGDWKKALSVQNSSELDFNKILWVKPSLEDLSFIEHAVKSRGLRTVVSIGCGSGFLEWLIQSATSLQVVGVEVNASWWRSPYTSIYIPHVYQEETTCEAILQNSSSVIMFCYFNNGPAFRDYLRLFTGKCLIIIGPKSKRHTDPHPFCPSFEDGDDWILKESKQIGDSVDFIVIYDRKIYAGQN